MKLEYLKEFLTLAQVGNYTLAAESLYISESTLSRHIMSLEKELRAQLFLRGGRGLSLTEAGTLLVPCAREAVEAMTEYGEALEAGRLARPRLTVGFGHAVQDYGLMELIYRFRREHPEMDTLLVEDKSETLWQMVGQGECDFALSFAYDSFDRTGLKTLPVLEDFLVAALPEGHPLAGTERLRLEQLREEHFILPARGASLTRFCLRLMREAGFEPRQVTYAGSLHLDMAARGMGVTFTERRRYQAETAGRVRFIELEPPIARPLLLVYRDRKLNSQCAAFLRFAETELIAPT